MKLEVVVISVSDVDRAKEFYERIGWRVNSDRSTGEDFRLVQLTPPGSRCSVHFGKNLTSAAPGSAKAFLIVSDIEAARDQLIAAGVEVGQFYHDGPEGRGSATRTGQTGMPPISWLSSPAQSCHNERLCSNRHRSRPADADCALTAGLVHAGFRREDCNTAESNKPKTQAASMNTLRRSPQKASAGSYEFRNYAVI